jgi:hypothetical protein
MGALGGIKSKGYDHKFYNNLIFDSWQSEDLQILRYYPSDQSCQPIGDNSVVVNNAGGTITGKATGNLDIASYAKYEAQYNYNEFVNSPKVRNLLRDYKNYDFRPRKDSTSLVDKGNDDAVLLYSKTPNIGSAVDIGAYEHGDSHYFIPGYQDTVPTFPIPPDNSKTVKYDADLMFLHARDAIKHELELFNETTSLFERQETFYGNDNIFSNCTWQQNSLIKWRVRAIFADGRTTMSPTWKFTVPKKEDVHAVILPTDDAAAYEQDLNKQNSNFGNSIKLRVRDELSVNSNRITSYLRFSLINDVTTDLKNSGCDILVKNASLKMQVFTQNEINELSLWSMNDTVWDEMVITGTNHPDGWKQRLQSKTNVGISSVVTFDIKDYISNVYSNNIDVFTFGLTSTQNKANLILYSKESDGVLKPTLDLLLTTTNCPSQVCERRDPIDSTTINAVGTTTAVATGTTTAVATGTTTAISTGTTTGTTTTIATGTTTGTTTNAVHNNSSTTTIISSVKTTTAATSYTTTDTLGTTTGTTTTIATGTTAGTTTNAVHNNSSTTTIISSVKTTTAATSYTTTDTVGTTTGTTTTIATGTTAGTTTNAILNNSSTTTIIRSAKTTTKSINAATTNAYTDATTTRPPQTTRPTDENEFSCCMASIASCLACTENVTVKTYCAKKKNQDVVGCRKVGALSTEIILVIVIVGIMCLCCCYMLKKYMFDANMDSHRSGKEIKVTQSGSVIELGTRQFSIRTPTSNPAHAVGLISRD